MQLPQVNYLAVFVAAIVIFLLGGLWYSPVLFSRNGSRFKAELKSRCGPTPRGPTCR